MRRRVEGLVTVNAIVAVLLTSYGVIVSDDLGLVVEFVAGTMCFVLLATTNLILYRNDDRGCCTQL